jgi:dihydrofolate reductase
MLSISDGAANTSTHSSVESALSTLSKVSPRSKTFLIGGAQLYNQSLSSSSLVNRILLTRVLDPPFDDCDTYLSNEFEQKGSGWERKGNDALSEFVGFHVADGEKEEKGVRYRFEMWERDLD